VVIVEDLVSTGMSSMAVVRAVREAGVEVAALLAIFSYGIPQATAQFTEAEVPFYTLTDFDTLLEVAREQGALTSGALRSLQAWQQDRFGWSEAHGGKGQADA
jgi:orotate phosphoribosyltransferase